MIRGPPEGAVVSWRQVSGGVVCSGGEWRGDVEGGGGCSKVRDRYI